MIALQSTYPVCTISSLVCVLACTRHIHVDVQYAVETAHGTPDVICTVRQHYEVKQTSALTFLMNIIILTTR